VNFYLFLATVVLALHVVFIGWVIFAALWTHCRPWLRWLHMVVLAWAVIVEVGPWPCPLTVAQNWLEARAGQTAYTGGFMLHYLDELVYPNIPPDLLTLAAILVVVANVAIYAQRFRHRHNGCW
jgi:hypothetical protein